MAGPGGGSFGGGARGGGSFSGGFKGGGGGHHHHHHHHGSHFIFFGRRRRIASDSIAAMIVLPFLLLLIAVLMFKFVVLDSINNIKEGKVEYTYDEQTFQDYANEQYYGVFDKHEAIEDNILLVVLTTEEADEYYYIAWVGDHVSTSVNELLGDERTLLGQSMNRHINQKGYWYSLDSNLGAVVDDLNNAISSKDNFTCNENHNYSESKFYNYSELDLNFGNALTNFTKDTGITMSIVVEDCKDVFEKDYSKLIFSSLFIAGLAILAIFLFVQGIKSKRKKNKIDDDEINEDKHESESNVIYDDGPLSNS